MRVQEESAEYKDKKLQEASSFVLILTTWPVDRDVAPLARALVDERLAACVNVLPPMVSIYRWQGAIEEAAERQVIVKTTAARADAAAARIRALHPYDVPELLVVPLAQGSAAYLEWLRESTEPG